MPHLTTDLNLFIPLQGCMNKSEILEQIFLFLRNVNGCIFLLIKSILKLTYRPVSCMYYRIRIANT